MEFAISASTSVKVLVHRGYFSCHIYTLNIVNCMSTPFCFLHIDISNMVALIIFWNFMAVNFQEN